MRILVIHHLVWNLADRRIRSAHSAGVAREGWQLISGESGAELWTAAARCAFLMGCWRRGLIVAGSCFILPAALIVTVFAHAYVQLGALPETTGILYGIKPVIIGVVLQALWELGRAAPKTKLLVLVGATGTVLGFLGTHELVILFGAGIGVGLVRLIGSESRRSGKRIFSLFSGAALAYVAPSALPGGAAVTASFGLWPLFLFFLRIGSVLFGSGYVLLAFLRADLVERWHWLSESQLLDAIAVGQVTPGPMLTTATFIGYIVGGLPGAFVSTVGIFLPAFFFVAVSGPLVTRIRRSATAATFLDGVNAASLALMAVVTLPAGQNGVD